MSRLALASAVGLAISACAAKEPKQTRRTERNRMVSAQQAPRVAGPSAAATSSTTTTTTTTAAADRPCPMKIQGSHVQTSDIDGGVVLTFSTDGDVAELRRRVQRMTVVRKETRVSNDGQTQVIRIRSSVEPVATGTRLYLRAADPHDVTMVRERARIMAENMSRGECPMLEEQGIMIE